MTIESKFQIDRFQGEDRFPSVVNALRGHLHFWWKVEECVNDKYREI